MNIFLSKLIGVHNRSFHVIVFSDTLVDICSNIVMSGYVLCFSQYWATRDIYDQLFLGKIRIPCTWGLPFLILTLNVLANHGPYSIRIIIVIITIIIIIIIINIIIIIIIIIANELAERRRAGDAAAL